MADERAGFVMRERQRMKRDIEDAAWAKFSSAVKAGDDGNR